MRPSFVVSLALLVAVPRVAPGAQMTGVDWKAIASKLVERMALTRGERVLLVGVPGQADSLVEPLRSAVVRAGGTDLGVLSATVSGPAGWESPFTQAAHGKSGNALRDHLSTVDLAVMLPGATPPQAAYTAMQAVLRAGRGRTIHFHWAGAYGLDGVLGPVTPARAQVYQRVLLTTNYAALAQMQQRFETAMRGQVVRVTTPAGTNLSFRIGERPVTRQDGDASLARARAARNLIDREVELPAGAIRVAPVEESVEGTIAFPPGVWADGPVEGLVMRFVKGRLAGYEVRSGKPAVEKELAAGGDAARAFREFALGFNPLLAIPATGERWIPYYGYGTGVVRLSLGDNSELGGAVTGGYVRWNFFVDATVTVGQDTWVREGQLVKR